MALEGFFVPFLELGAVAGGAFALVLAAVSLLALAGFCVGELGSCRGARAATVAGHYIIQTFGFG